jgi:predicted glycoside hydrolase/deacetylase ChbG (UPF0249 family)
VHAKQNPAVTRASIGDDRRRLIINADDFGLTEGVNRAVLELNAAGALTSTTLMATGPAFRSAVHASFVQTTLDVGCHVVLVDGAPVLPHTQIPTLAGTRGFRSTLGQFVSDLLRGRIRDSEIEAEAAAQIQRIQSSGLTVSHVDTHKHTHMFARVLRPLLRAAGLRGVAAIRNPFEPGWSIRATAAGDPVRRMQVTLLRSQRPYFLRAVKQANMHTTDGSIGVLATGTLDAETIQRLLSAMPAGTWELVCHPGYQDDALAGIQTRLRASRETERTALEQVFRPENNSIAQLIDFNALRRPS